MADEETSRRARHLRKPLLYSSFALLLALLYVGWVFYSRWEENRAIEKGAAAKKREEDRRTVESMGGSRLEIQSFYAVPSIVHRGETVELCYGVANAKTVRLEPQSHPVWPSYARCVDVMPSKDTTYTLTAEDGQGNVAKATVTVRIADTRYPAPPAVKK